MKGSRILAAAFIALVVALVLVDTIAYDRVVCSSITVRPLGNGYVEVRAPGVFLKASTDKGVVVSYSVVTVPRGSRVEPCMLWCLLSLPCTINTYEEEKTSTHWNNSLSPHG